MQKINLPIELEKGDNTKPSKPDFSWALKMIGICAFFVIITFGFFYSFSYFIISKISIEKEKEIFGNLYVNEDMEKFDLSLLKTKVKKFKNYDIYINDTDEINAYATPGANIFINRGLLENIKNEEELIFILAHEIGHIENRHILKKFSMEMPFLMTLNFLGLNYGNSLIKSEDLLGNLFSRNNEKEADKAGIKILNNLGLNLKCATNFFEELEKNRKIKVPEILSTHPSDKNRIKNILKENKNNEKKCINFYNDLK